MVAPAYMTGGQAIEARTLVDGFAADHDIRVELQPIDPRIPAWLAALRGVRTVARMPLYLAGLLRRIARADVVHVFTAAYWPFLVTTTPAVLLARALRRPVVLNYRDGRAADHIRHRWVRWVLRRASVLVFPSGFLRDTFARFGLAGEVVPNVVDTARFRFRARTPLQPVLLSCRLLEELYAVENTLLAFEQVRAHRPAARLIVLGGGDRETALRALVRERGIAGVEFVGAVPHDDVAAWFDRADILVNSSRIDNMPHSLIEAFAAGLAVVTTPAGGIPYVVEHEVNGLHVRIDDPADMAAAVLLLLDEPETAQRLIERGRRDSAERYAWTAAKQRWMELYASMAPRAARPPALVEASS